MNKKNKTIYIIIIVFFAIIGIITIIIGKMSDKGKNLYLVIPGSLQVKYRDGKFNEIDENRFDELTKFNVYSNNYLGRYNMMLANNTWLIYNLDKSDTNINDLYIAISGERKYQFVQFSKTRLNNNDEVQLKQHLKERGINNYYDLQINEKILLDIDNDKKDEEVYCVSNINSSYEEEKLFSFIYIKDDNKYSYLKDEIYDNDTDHMEISQSYIYFILKFDNRDNIFTINVSSENQTSNIYAKIHSKYQKIY